MKKEIYGYIEGFGEGPDANGDIINPSAWEEAVLRNERVAHEAGVGPILTKDFDPLQVMGQVQKVERDEKGIKVTAKLNDDGVAFLESQAQRFGQTLADATGGGVFRIGGRILEKQGNVIKKMAVDYLSLDLDPDHKPEPSKNGSHD